MPTVVRFVKGYVTGREVADDLCAYRKDRRFHLWHSFYKSRRRTCGIRRQSASSITSAPELKGDLQAQPDDLGTDPSAVGPKSAGQTASSLGLSAEPEAIENSVEDLSDSDQALEAASVEGLEDAADHPERPTHTHDEYGRPDDVPPPDELCEAWREVAPASCRLSGGHLARRPSPKLQVAGNRATANRRSVTSPYGENSVSSP